MLCIIYRAAVQQHFRQLREELATVQTEACTSREEVKKQLLETERLFSKLTTAKGKIADLEQELSQLRKYKERQRNLSQKVFGRYTDTKSAVVQLSEFIEELGQCVPRPQSQVDQDIADVTEAIQRGELTPHVKILVDDLNRTTVQKGHPADRDKPGQGIEIVYEDPESRRVTVEQAYEEGNFDTPS